MPQLTCLISNNTVNSFDENAVLSFLWFRKVIGDKTFNKKIKFLNYASNLSINTTGNILINKYWHIKYSKKIFKGTKLINKISHSLKRSVDAHMSDEKNFGLFLINISVELSDDKQEITEKNKFNSNHRKLINY